MAAPAATRSDSLPSLPASYVTIDNLRTPKTFHGDFSEDAQDWLEHFECVASFNGWDYAAKIRNVYFSLEDAARTWYENCEATLLTWQDFRSQLLATYTSIDHRERTKRALNARIQLPNKSVVTMYVEDVTRLCKRADPAMAEDKKLRHLMRGVKEQLFCGLVRSPPRTVAEFLSEAALMERELQQWYNQYERQMNSVPMLHSLDAAPGAAASSLRDHVRFVIREELQKLHEALQADSLTTVFREEVQQTLRALITPVEPVQLPASFPPTAYAPVEPAPLPTYADVVRRSAPYSCAPLYASPVAAVHAVQPVP